MNIEGEITEHELRELCGYVEDGSHVTVAISQDDATKDWVVTVNKKQYYGRSMREALRNAGQIKEPT